MYFDDLHEGFTFETESRQLSRDDIMSFAREWDPQAFHVDEEAARASPFGGLVASGFHTLMTSFVLTLETDTWKEASMGSPGIEEVRWLLPVRPDDTLRVRGTVLKSRPSQSRPDRGRTTIRCETLNQKNEVVMSYTAIHILRRRF